MTYTPTTWASGNTVTPTLLNKIEQGIVDAEAAATAGTGLDVLDAKADGGLLGNGTTENSTSVNTLFSTASSSGKDIVFPAGTYKFNTGFTWDATAHSVIAMGDVRFDCTGMSSGYAITVTGQAAKGNTFGFTPVRHVFKGIRINGPDTDATTVDCFKIEDTGNASHTSLEHMYVYGFRDQVWLGTNTWINRFYACKFSHFHRYGINADAGTNAGENFQFYGCAFDSSHNATTDTATGYFQAVGSAADTSFFGCSFDYNDIEADIESGTANFFGCHFEDNHATNPMIKAVYTGGNEHTVVTISGGQFSPTEGTTRTSYINVTNDNAYVTLTGVKWNTFNRGGAELVRVTAQTPAIKFSGGDIVAGGTGIAPIPSQAINVLQNPGFETTTLAGWTTGAVVTYSNQTANVHSGTRAARIVGTGTAGTSSMSQKFPVRPGESVHMNAWIASSSMTGGSVAFSIVWKAQDGTTTVGSTSTFTTVSGNQSYTFVGGARRAPVQAAYAMVEFFANNLNGTVDIDDVYAMAM